MSDLTCRKCGFIMESTANAKAAGKLAANGPDWKCTNVNCKFTWDYKNKVWLPGKFRTSLWDRDLTEHERGGVVTDSQPTMEQLNQAFGPGPTTTVTPMPTPLVPPTMSVTPVDPEAEVWERKDRTSMAQTSVNVSATVHQGRDVEVAKLLTYADQVYSWLEIKRNTK